MATNWIQQDLFIQDFKKLKKHLKEQKKKKSEKQVRFIMHLASKLADEHIEKKKPPKRD